jgi:hypothetical protein
MPVRAAETVRCRSCKRLVHHSHPMCNGNHSATCHSFGCGLEIYRTVWDERARRSYCLRCYNLFLEREQRRCDAADLAVEPTPHEEEPVPPQTPLRPTILRPASVPSSERVLMNIHPQVRERLRELLAEPEMRGVGYSAFINRAVCVAEAALADLREEEREARQLRADSRLHIEPVQPVHIHVADELASLARAGATAGLPQRATTERLERRHEEEHELYERLAR